jgi:putative hemolysin
LIKAFGEQGIAYATVLKTFLILIFSEVTPKSYALFHAESLGITLVPFIKSARLLLFPIAWLVTGVSRLLLRSIGGVSLEFRPTISEDEIRYLLLYGPKGGAFAKDRRLMLLNVLELAETRVMDVMVPRAKMVGIELNTPVRDVLYKAKKTGFSRFPVYRDDIGNVVGILHIKDLLLAMALAKPPSIATFMKSAFFVPEVKRTDELLREMRAKKLQMVLVVDEYGTVVGLVTLEDLLEEIVGEIFDEFDRESERVRRLPDGSFLIDGDVSIKDLNRMLELGLPEEQASTLAGYLLKEFQDMPQEKQRLETEKAVFVVEQVGAQRIVRVRVIPKAARIP